MEFAKHGSNLVIAARRSDRLAEIYGNIIAKFPKTKIHQITMDVRNRQPVFDAINNLPSDFKNIHVLVNNAGLGL